MDVLLIEKALYRAPLRARQPAGLGSYPAARPPPPWWVRGDCRVAPSHAGGQDLYLFNEGSHLRGWLTSWAAHLTEGGCQFAVWAPNRGGRCRWSRTSTAGTPRGPDRALRAAPGIWQGFVSGVERGGGLQVPRV